MNKRRKGAALSTRSNLYFSKSLKAILLYFSKRTIKGYVYKTDEPQRGFFWVLYVRFLAKWTKCLELFTFLVRKSSSAFYSKTLP